MIHTRELIREAFSGHKKPQSKVSVGISDDEDTHKYFAGTTWDEHDAIQIRKYSSAICFFTPEAFAYYLPAFMLAEIDNPEEADIIAEDLAGNFIDAAYNLRMTEFSKEEISAIIAFFELCAERYPDGIYDATLREAANTVRDYEFS